MLTLDLGKVVQRIDPEDTDVLRKTQAKILSGEDEWFARNIDRMIREYAESLNLEAQFSWSELVFTLKDGDDVKELVVNPVGMGRGSEKLSVRAYLFLRGFFSSLSSVLFSRSKGKRPPLLLVDTGEEGGFSFFWQLNQSQSKALSRLLEGSSEAHEDISMRLKEMSLATGESVNFSNGDITNTHKKYSQFREDHIMADHLPRKMGLLCLGFYCWLLDEAESRQVA